MAIELCGRVYGDSTIAAAKIAYETYRQMMWSIGGGHDQSSWHDMEPCQQAAWCRFVERWLL